MESNKWKEFKGRIAPTTVQQLLEHTEEIDQQIEKVLVGLFNDMNNHRIKVAEVTSHLDEIAEISDEIKQFDQFSQSFLQRITVLEQALADYSKSKLIMQKKTSRLLVWATINFVISISALLLIAIR